MQHVTFYSFSLENHVSILYHFRNIVSYLLKVANFSYPTSIWHPAGGDPTGISRRALLQKLDPTLQKGAVLHDDMCSCFDRILAGDGQTDRHRAIAHTALA